MAALNIRALLLLVIFRRRRKRLKNKYKKRFWVRKIFKERNQKGEYHLLVKDLRLFDHEFFFKNFRMLPEKFEQLLSYVAPMITKSSFRRECISADQRLCITLRYLVTGDAKATISSSYRVSSTTVGRIISETCEAIWIRLLEEGYLKCPTTPAEWKKIAQRFEKIWQFPNCVGAIDGKHIVMQAPQRAGSYFFNYKKTHSIVLMAVCDADYNFLLVDVGDSGRQSDGGVFFNGNIAHAINENLLNLPKPRLFFGNDRIEFPFVFVGDEAFPLKTNLIKPYPRNSLNNARRIFNYRLSRARRVIENTFGICASRFRILRRSIVAKVENVTRTTEAIVALHNFLMDDKKMYCPQGFADHIRDGCLREGSWRTENIDCAFRDIGRVGTNNFTNEAKEVRENFCEYFMSNFGSVPWQHNAVTSTLDLFDMDA